MARSSPLCGRYHASPRWAQDPASPAAPHSSPCMQLVGDQREMAQRSEAIYMRSSELLSDMRKKDAG